MNVRNLLQSNSITERSNWAAEVILNNEYLSEILATKVNTTDLATVATSGAYADLSGKPTKLSDFSNDSGFIDNTVNNLTNYYLSSNTYTKAEVNSLIASVVTLNIEVVATLPVSDISTHTIYLVPKTTAGTQDVYDEYINTDGTSAGWEHIGSTEVDLSNYYTKTEIDLKVGDLSASVLRVEGEIPSKVSELQNDSGFIDSSGSCAYATTAGSATDSTKVAKAGDTMTGALTINRAAATQAHFKRNNSGSTTTAASDVYIGNDIADGTDGASYGRLRIYSQQTYDVRLYCATLTANRNILLPNKGGTIALTSDVDAKEDKVAWTNSGDWKYWQDSEGYYHFEYYKDITLNFNTNYKGGVIYVPADVWYVNFPKTLSGLKGCNVTTKYSSDIMGASIHSIATNKLGVWFWRCNSGSITFGVNISLVGWA